MKILRAGIIGFTCLLAACGTTTPDDYADKTPKLDIRRYLNGPLEAWGIIYSRDGREDTQFHVDMVGSWQGNNGTLDEHFLYSDGRTEQRVWNFTFNDDRHFTATAGDVEGEGTGSQNGNTANMRYILHAKRASGDMITLSMDDWLYLMDDKTLINRTKMHKFGLEVGEVVLTFRKK